MINLTDEIVFLVDDSTLVSNVKNALIDIKSKLVEAGVNHEIKMVKRADSDRYYDSNEEFKPAVLQSYSAPELTAIILDDNFIGSLDVNKELIKILLTHSTFNAGSSLGLVQRAKEHGYLSNLIAPVKEHSQITYYGQRGDQHVVNGFWRFVTLPLMIRLWQSKTIVLPLTSRISHYLANTNTIKDQYVNLCLPEGASNDLSLFVQGYRDSLKESRLKSFGKGMRITSSMKDLKRDYPAFLRLLLSTDWYERLNLSEVVKSYWPRICSLASISSLTHLDLSQHCIYVA